MSTTSLSQAGTLELAAGDGMFSMPAAAQAIDGRVHVVFTDGDVTRLKHAIIEVG